jgi:hypothetical protein
LVASLTTCAATAKIVSELSSLANGPLQIVPGGHYTALTGTQFVEGIAEFLTGG